MRELKRKPGRVAAVCAEGQLRPSAAPLAGPPFQTTTTSPHVTKSRRKFQPPTTKTGEPCKRCTKLGKLCKQHAPIAATEGRQHRKQETQKTQLKKVARKPTQKFTERRRSRYLELLATGAWRGAAAKAVGVGRSTPLRTMRAEPDFAAAVEEAEMQADEEVEEALRGRALSGNVPALIFWLTNRAPERWVNTQRRDVHHQGIADADRERFVRAAAVAGLDELQLEAMARELENDDDETQH